MKPLLVIVTAIVSSTHPAGADDDHLALVQRYADALIKNGTDSSVMAYNYRLILTRDPANKIMVERPANFDLALAKAASGVGFVPNLPNRKVAWKAVVWSDLKTVTPTATGPPAKRFQNVTSTPC
jgi:hypothetical protein